MRGPWNMVYLLFLGVFVLSFFGTKVNGLGVNWGTKSYHQLSPETVVQMLKDNGIKKVKLFDADKNVLDALADTGIAVMVAVQNSELEQMTNKTNAKNWIKENVVKHVDKKVNITGVAVGNEPFLKENKDMYINTTRPALEKIQRALNEVGVGDKIKATVPLSGDVCMSPPWKPYPSAGIFRPDVSDEVEEIVDFLAKFNAPFMININPFMRLTWANGDFPFDYAFFDGEGGIKDGDIDYMNVFDADYDTCLSALKQVGHKNMTVLVGEVGWPTDGNKWANNSLASRFYRGFLPKMAENKGTPLHPGYTEVYLSGLLDEDAKSVLPGYFERHWGIFDYAGQPKFKANLHGKDQNNTLVGAKDVKYQSRKWCVLKLNAHADHKKLNKSATYACEHADCSAFAHGGSCSGLTHAEKTSYAINAFFQVSNQTDSSCDFGGLATEIDNDPSKGRCKFNIQIMPYEPPGSSSKSSWFSPGSWFSSSSHRTCAPPVALMVLVILAMVSLFFF